MITWDFFNFPKKLFDRRPIMEVKPVIGCVLCDQVKFFHSHFFEIFDLLDNIINRPASLFSTQPGDDAERAGMVASLGNLHIGGVGGGCEEARGF